MSEEEAVSSPSVQAASDTDPGDHFAEPSFLLNELGENNFCYESAQKTSASFNTKHNFQIISFFCITLEDILFANVSFVFKNQLYFQSYNIFILRCLVLRRVIMK